MKPTKQIYTSYTPEDFLVWQILFDRQVKELNNKVSNDYLIALKKIGFTAGSIPDFNEINKLLMNYTGWQIVTVPCISEQKDFFTHLSKLEFTATCWLRKLHELDYLEEPDMFHDVFGHVPLLSNSSYCKFFKGLGDIGLQHLNSPKIIQRLGRLYWFTIEFGLIKERGDLKIYGAGIISSTSETKNALSKDSIKKAFSVEAVFETDFRTDILQDTYFVINSFEELADSLIEIEEKIERLALEQTL